MLFNLYDSTLDLGENLDGRLPKEYQKIYFKEILDPHSENWVKANLAGYNFQCFRIHSQPPNYYELDLDKESCMVPNRFSFYWNHLANFPATFSKIVRKIPKLLNIKNGCVEWKGKYKKIW
ncbi:hypothetical protein [Okeania sp. KiyG1]|uniref:hypothetical protein n=1 Tax=Okeania sp. KiyG1 TaxID=2720165 RepID=UPI0019241FD7|nr:hypothetical protein [Okeania sp. KiyG1]GGA14747.1 hypothetical protein CYANOKiyG1_28470 [Okeania sp. KiyG1]